MSGMGNIFELMQNAKHILEKAKNAEADLIKKHVQGTAGAGLVTATLNGAGDLVALNFDKSVIDPNDPDMLADLVIAAVADARKKLVSVRTDAMQDLAGGLDFSALGRNGSDGTPNA